MAEQLMRREVLLDVLGRMVNDPPFAKAFQADPRAALLAHGFDLSDAEIQRLLTSDGTQSEGPRSEVLDDRIKRRSDDMM